MQQRCQWSAAKAGVTSVLRLHDATNANLPMKHDVAKEAANEMALKEIDAETRNRKTPRKNKEMRKEHTSAMR